MSSPDFAYRPLLQELTSSVVDEGLDPYEAYQWLYEHSENAGLQANTYCSTSITSGGHARDESLEMRDVIERNTESARLLSEQLAHDRQIEPAAAIEPVFVGKTHWNQPEFMEFWLSVIGGYTFTTGFVSRDVNNLRASAKSAFQSHELDVDLMSSKASAEVRAVEYFKMSNAFANLITSGTPAKPIDIVIRMIDTELSLGAQTERAFARQIGSRVMNIAVVKPAQPEDLFAVNRVLAEDTARLIRFGATVFDTRTSSARLVLTEDAA